MKQKTFYLVSSLTHLSANDLHSRIRYESEAEAIDRAKSVIDKRTQEGKPPMGFYILKAQAFVGHVNPPVKVTKLGKG